MNRAIVLIEELPDGTVNVTTAHTGPKEGNQAANLARQLKWDAEVYTTPMPGAEAPLAPLRLGVKPHPPSTEGNTDE